jgi:hypothetical protein
MDRTESKIQEMQNKTKKKKKKKKEKNNICCSENLTWYLQMKTEKKKKLKIKTEDENNLIVIKERINHASCEIGIFSLRPFMRRV